MRNDRRPGSPAQIAGASLIVLAAATWTPAQAADQPSWANVKINDTTRALGNYGAGVTVGILDTPIDLDHPALNVLRPALLHPLARRVVEAHGTHVAGTVGGMYGYGAAPSAQLFDISVLSPYGAWGSATLTVRSALSVAARYGVSIANMSFGYSGGYSLDYDEYTSFSTFRRKILAVKAAGNDGMILKSVRSPNAASTYIDNLMLVGSVNSSNQISSFSNRPGEGCFSRYSNGRWVCFERDKYKYFTIVAPGENITSSAPGGRYTTLSGTSMATPHVAGAAALLQGRWSFLKSRPQATANILFRSATDLGAPGVDGVYGWGLLNMERAFQPIGQTQLASTTKTYPTGTSTGYSGTGTLNQMIGWGTRISALSTFDEFERDFKVAARSISAEPRSAFGGWLSDYLSGTGAAPLAATQRLRIDDDITASFTAVAGALDDVAAGATQPRSEFQSEVLDPVVAPAWSFMAENVRSGSSLFAGHKAGSGALGLTTLSAMRPEGLGGETAGLENPILGLATSGSYAGATVAAIKGVSLVAGYAEAEERPFLGSDYGAGAAVAGLRFEPTDTLKLGIVATELQERDGLFGSMGSGALSLGDRFQTSAVTVSGSWKPALDWEFAAAATFASTRQKGAGTDLLTLDGAVISNAATLGISRSNVLGEGDRLSLTAALPLTAVRGHAHSTLASHLDEGGNLVVDRYDHDMSKSGPRQLDVTLGYAATVWDHSAVLLGAFASFNDAATAEDVFGGFASYRSRF